MTMVRPATFRSTQRQSGITLVVVLVVLAIFGVAIASIVRSSMATGRIASNVAFKQSSTQAAEFALSAAEQFVVTRASGGLTDTAVANQYFAILQTTDSSELPTTVNWSNVATTSVGSFTVQWVVERMCTAVLNTAPPPDPQTVCLTLQSNQQGSQRAGSPAYVGSPSIYYRITARVTGPRDTETFVQTAVSR